MILTQDHQGAAQPRGSSQQREEPQPGSSQQRGEPGERWWEDHRSSPGSPGSRINLPPEEVGLAAEEEQEPYFEAEDHVQEEAAALWVTEDQLEGDYLSDRVTSSVSASNPWVLYEAGVICSRLRDGSSEQNPNGERIINLREWGYLLTKQRVVLRRQDINGRNFLGQDTIVIIFSQGPGRLADGSHNIKSRRIQ